jgi:DNA-binding NarL/FixJ family response regulator
MNEGALSCVLLADRHHGLTEGVRDLLATVAATVVMVADEASLIESASRLQPEVAVVDLSLSHGRGFRWLSELRAHCPLTRVIVLSVYNEEVVRRTVMQAGADGFVLKSGIVTDLLPAIDEALAVPVKGPTAIQGEEVS